MNNAPRIVTGLVLDQCRERQARLAARLRGRDISGALVTDPRHIYYLTGYMGPWFHAPLLLLQGDGASHLVAGVDVDPKRHAAAKSRVYESHQLCTLVDDQFRGALRTVKDELRAWRSLGTDSPQILAFRDDVHDISQDLFSMRRTKDADELEILRHSIRACEAGYARAAGFLSPGVREIDVFAELQAAVIKELGEPIGELGNDFQAGAPGGPPRNRCVEAGELMPLDVGVAVRHYRSDLCRTMAVDEPSADQREAASKVEDALHFAEGFARAGASCRELFGRVTELLDGYRGWRFQHHLGHGIGLAPHEAPRINSYSDDYFQIGDVFTFEPGIYHDDLRAGIRIEQNYWLSPNGLVRLSSFPTSL